MCVHSKNEPRFDPENFHMTQEIGNIKWCSFDEALQLIRVDNSEKRDVLQRVNKILHNFCPFKFGPLN